MNASRLLSRTIISLAAVGLPLLGEVSLPFASARPALAQQEGLEAAKTSRLVAALALPDGGFRATSGEHVAQF